MDSTYEETNALHEQNLIPNINLSKRKGKATLIRPSSSPFILNFTNADNSLENPRQVNLWPLISPTEGSDQDDLKHKISKAQSEKYDHVIAERKRREHISQQFIALSGMVPGLKKLDKTSVLVDTIKYLKNLQERVQTLEERRTKHTIESVVLVRKSQIMAEDQGSNERSLPEIEVKFSEDSVFLKIHCEKQKGVVAEILSQVEKLNLLVVNINVGTIGNLALCVTIVAEMEKEFNSSVQNIVEDLRSCMVGT